MSLDRFSSLLIIATIAGSLYFVKNIKISVSGAEAARETSLESVEQEAYGDSEESPNESASARVPSRKPQSFSSDSADPIQELVQLIQSRKLCDFLELSKEQGLGWGDQLQALSLSLGSERFDELTVFAQPGIENLNLYRGLAARSYIIARDREAFSNMSFTGGPDFSKGMQTKHVDLLFHIDEMASRDPDNLFFAMLRNDIYHRYINVPDESKAMLFDKVMATTSYENPVHSLVRDLYQATKSNVVQFYIAHKILFDTPVELDSNFIGRTIWRFYDESMRYHINSLLAKSLEGVSHSAKTFSYEPGVYNAYRNSLHYTDYEAAPELSAFEDSKVQPTYGRDDLRYNFDGDCDPNKVTELEIKLRAL